MFVVDTNVLLYSVNEDADHHTAARNWLANALGGTETVGFDWVAILGFLRIASHPRVFPTPMRLGPALDIVDRWLSAPAAEIVRPATSHSSQLRKLLEHLPMAGNIATDAHLAAICLSLDATMVSFDRDFGRFPGLRWMIPGEGMSRPVR